MARVIGKSASALAKRSPSRAAQRRARRHKVILESVTQEKKKLRSVICFEAKAPSGYTFIPAGNPLLTTACKERCRAEGLQIHAVSTTPHHRSHNLSQHVHRIGYHFPSTVVANVCSELGFYLTSTGKAVAIYATGRTDEHKRADSEISQITLNTEARDALRDLFPNIPDTDLNQIIKTAFQKGTKKVGTATELPMARRAQLAVVAHIRHVYTDYDRLLKQLSFHEARGAVEHMTLSKLIEWRGDDENGQTVLEDIFREVIVISDDEDSEFEEDEAPKAGRNSVEILPNHPRAHEIRSQPISNTQPPNQDLPREPSEEAPPGFRFVVPAKDTTDRRGFHRYQAWNRIHGFEHPRFARGQAGKRSPRYAEQRSAAQDLPAARRHDMIPQRAEVGRRAILGSVSIDSQLPRVPATPLMDRQRHVGVRESHIHSGLQPKMSAHELKARPTELTNQESPELQVLEELSGPRNTNLIHLQDVPPSRMEPRSRRERPSPQPDRTNAPVFVAGPQEKRHKWNPIGRYTDSSVRSTHPRPGSNAQDVILPSIENPWPSEHQRTEAAHPLVHMTNQMSLRSVTPGYPQGGTMHNPDVVERGRDSEPASKRRRLASEDPRDEPRPDLRTTRPMGIPISAGLAYNPHRYVELIPDYRPPDQPHLRRDYLPVEQGPLVGQHQRERNIALYSNGQHGHDTRAVLGRPPISGPRELQNRPGFSSTSIIVSEGEHAFRTVPAVSDPEHWHPYPGDRSLRPDRAPVEPSIRRRSRVDRGRPLPEDIQTDRDLYADGFVQHVDYHEPPPYGFVSRRPEPETQPTGDVLQKSRPRAFENLRTKQLYRTQALSDQHGPVFIGSCVAPSHEYVRTFSDSAPTGKAQPRGSTPQLPLERPIGGGLAFLRSPWDHPPSSSQTMEQNRPVYVQRVEPRSPSYSHLDGRRIVIVD
ncbi:hypothetical protein N7535_002297 [Penicillium sp. DV-2018c]|nr:hypothetical protein N7461_004459 [Penicillium sp. DV-2018c]KAJ5583677.1 hypothetical protein N7535_002297 [Penicillium sp. DV-2018c]